MRPECVPALISALDNHEGQQTAEIAASYLGLLGERAKDAVPALARILDCDFARSYFSDHHPHGLQPGP